MNPIGEVLKIVVDPTTGKKPKIAIAGLGAVVGFATGWLPVVATVNPMAAAGLAAAVTVAYLAVEGALDYKAMGVGRGGAIPGIDAEKP